MRELCDWFNAGVRFVLKVPFHEKEQAKKMGCRWIEKQWCYDYDMRKECINIDELMDWKWRKSVEAIQFFEILHWFPYGAIEMSEEEKSVVNNLFLFNIREYRENYATMKQQQEEARQKKISEDVEEYECKRLCKEQGITGKDEKKHFLEQYRLEKNLRRRIWEIVGDSDDDEGFEKEMQRFIDFEISKRETP
jgi:hypothetical protein